MAKDMETFTLETKRSKSGYSSVSRQFNTLLTLCIICLIEEAQMVEMGVLVPTLFHWLKKANRKRKLPAGDQVCNMCVHLCNRNIDSLICE